MNTKTVPAVPTDEMLDAGRIAGDFHIMCYDGTDKPGTPRYSLAKSYAAMLAAAPEQAEGEAVYIVYYGDGENAVGEVDKSEYDSHKGNKRILYAAAPRVAIDEAMVERAFDAYLTTCDFSRREGIREALKSALEKKQ